MQQRAHSTDEFLNSRQHFGLLASYNYKTDFLIADTKSNSFLHELIHFNDHASTPYGYFLDSSTSLISAATRQLLKEFNAENAPPIPVPLAPLLSDIERLVEVVRSKAPPSYNMTKCEDLLIVTAILWRSIVGLERNLEGMRSAVFPNDAAGAVGGFRAVEGLQRAGYRGFPRDVFELKSVDMGSEDWNFTESVIQVERKTQIIEYKFGAAALLETRAFFMERGLYDSDTLPALLSREALAYYAPLGALANICLSLGISDVRQITDTYLALSDLALCSPIGERYRSLRSKDDWSQIHPGVRFIRLINSIEDIGPFKRDDCVDVFDYQERYSQTLNWPSPRLFLSLGSNLADNDYRSKRHRAACKLKLSYPRYFVNANLEYLELPSDDELMEWMRFMPFVSDKSGLNRNVVGDQPTEIYTERLLESYLQSLGWSICTRSDPDAVCHLPAEFPYSRYIRWPGDGSLAEFFDSRIRPHVTFEIVNGA